MLAPVLLDVRQLELINRYQHNMPLTPCPYAAMANTLGWSRQQVLDVLTTLSQQKVLSRFGPVFEHRRAGASTLVAMAVPPDKLENVAAHINSYTEVNHNYERENHYNLWFVLTATDVDQIDHVLKDIWLNTGYQPISLPMVQPFHIDLGFPMALDDQGRAVVARQLSDQYQVDEPIQDPAQHHDDALPVLDDATQTSLRRWLEDGLPLAPHPWQQFAQHHGVEEAAVLSQVRQWQAEGLFRRCGIVVRHHPLGIRSNLMLVLDIPDHEVHALGTKLGSDPIVTLCYQRRRHLPEWPYNLFCMVHGHDRAMVEQQAGQMLVRHNLMETPHEFLFSLRAFKQRGGRYLSRTRQNHLASHAKEAS